MHEYQNVKINTSLIPKIEVSVLCAAFLEATMKFYENDENKAGFEKWLKEREGGGIDEQSDSRKVKARIF